MNRHLVTRRTGDDLELLFDVEGEQAFAYTVSRVAIGVSFPSYDSTAPREYGYACVVGERTFGASSHNRHPERLFAIIDESEATNANDLMDTVIALKDRYLASMVFCRHEPKEMVTNLKRLEGLTHYNEDRIAEECRRIWPTWQDFEAVAKVRPTELPGREQVHRDLDHLLTTYLRDPDTFQPMLDMEGKPSPKLFVMKELNTQRASVGIQRGMDEPEICGAIWLAAVGLNRSMQRARAITQPAHVWKGAGHTGY